MSTALSSQAFFASAIANCPFRIEASGQVAREPSPTVEHLRLLDGITDLDRETLGDYLARLSWLCSYPAGCLLQLAQVPP